MIFVPKSGEELQVSDQALNLIGLIQDMNSSLDETDKMKKLDLKDFKKETVEKFIGFIEHHKENEGYYMNGELPEPTLNPSVDEEIIKINLDQWSRNYLDTIYKGSQSDFWEYFRLVNFLSCWVGLDMATAYTGELVRGMSLDEMEKEFGLLDK